MEKKQELASDLLAIKAVQINPDHYFTWTSGIKAPIYCDNRLTMSYPEIRKKISAMFISIIAELGIQPDAIAGCATAGIPHAAWLANELNLPMVYVRSKPKGHGKGNQIEGAIKAGQKVILIEDLISTGGSAIEAAKALQREGVEVLRVLAIFTYGLKQSYDHFADAKLAFQAITGFDDIIDLLTSAGELHPEQKNQLIKWRDSL